MNMYTQKCDNKGLIDCTRGFSDSEKQLLSIYFALQVIPSQEGIPVKHCC